jgi:DNA-binding XRE family transcriptional regulator
MVGSGHLSLLGEGRLRWPTFYLLSNPRNTHLGLTQRQLGELAGVAHTTVQQLESLNRGAYPQTMQKLALALGLAPEELLHGESSQR